MTGLELKEKLAAQSVSSSTIAKKLGITPQALDSTFKSKDVRSNTLERIAAVLGVDMGFFYPIGSTTNTNVNNLKKQSAHNLHQGNGNITENASNNDAMMMLLQQTLKQRFITIYKNINRKLQNNIIPKQTLSLCILMMAQITVWASSLIISVFQRLKT